MESQFSLVFNHKNRPFGALNRTHLKFLFSDYFSQPQVSEQGVKVTETSDGKDRTLRKGKMVTILSSSGIHVIC